MAVCQTVQARTMWCSGSYNLTAPLKGQSFHTKSSRFINVNAPCSVNLHPRSRAPPCMSRVVDGKDKEVPLGQSLKWSVQTFRFHRRWIGSEPRTSWRRLKGFVPRASDVSPHSSQSNDPLLRAEAQRANDWSNGTDSQSESGSDPLRGLDSPRWASFLLGFAIGCVVAVLLPATSYWLSLCRQKTRSQSQPPVTAVSTVHRPSSEEPNQVTAFQPSNQVAVQPRYNQSDSFLPNLESADYNKSPILLPRAKAFVPRFEGDYTEGQPAGLALAGQDIRQLERSASGSQTGPSSHEALPAKPSASKLGSRSLIGPIKSQDSPVSPDIAAGISLASSPKVHEILKTRLVWDSGAVDSAGMAMTSASHQLPFVNPPSSADPFASRAVWDSGSEPARAAFSISAPETPPPTDSPWSSAVKLCSHTQRGSGLPFRLILKFPTKGNSFVRAAAERVGPSVVRINTERSQPSEGGKDLFSKFFGGEDLALEDRAKDREQGQGSGFVVDGRQGIIVTNAHVINRADTVLVTFTDGRTFRGAVVGTDELTDLAVIKVELPQWESLPKAPLGDSNSLEVGDWVIAVGNPFGLDNTVTLGIVSCLHRQAAEIGIPEKRVDFLQTDCAINPGNSGGPLLNEFGKVVGINTAIRADAEGISFAIPINYARKIVDVLSQGLPVRHAYIGVQVVTITPGLARQHNTEPGSRGVLPEVGGLLVANVADGSPAEAAGLRSGDVILEMDGRRLRSTGELQCVIAYSDVGQVIKVKTRRRQETIILNIVAGDLTPLLSAKNGGSPRQK